MAVDASDVFFTEEDYENFSLQAKFDIDLFKTYNQCIEECAISPVKKSKPSHVNKSSVVTGVAELSPSVQPNRNAPSCNIPEDTCFNQRWDLKSPKPRFPYPRYSFLTHAQQQRYIKLWQKHGLGHPTQARYNTCPDDIVEKQELRKLQILVHQEQQEFMNYAEHVSRHCPKDYEYLHPLVLQYAKNQWKYQEQRVKRLPQHFNIYQTIGIVPSAVFPTDPVLTFSTHLLVLGQACKIEESTIGKKVKQNLILASNKQNQHKQVAAEDNDTHEELSNDENAVKLASKYQANMVIAAAALETLADNHAPHYNKRWHIPVHIKTAKMTDTDTTLRTVYISAPLINSYFHYEASTSFHQVALQELLNEDTQAKSSLHVPEQIPAKDFGTSMEVDNKYDDSLELDLSSLETFGIVSETSTRKKLEAIQMCPKLETKRPASESHKPENASLNVCPNNLSGNSRVSSSCQEALSEFSCVEPTDNSHCQNQELMNDQYFNPSSKMPPESAKKISYIPLTENNEELHLSNQHQEGVQVNQESPENDDILQETANRLTMASRGFLSGDMSSSVTPEEAYTPRRSQRLSKIQPSNIKDESSLTYSSEMSHESSLPNIHLSPSTSAEKEKVLVSVHSQENSGMTIPDSPISPPHLDRETFICSSISPPSSNGNEILTSVLPVPPQMNKLKGNISAVPDSSELQNRQTPSLRYNLRSKLGKAGNVECSVTHRSDGMSDGTTVKTVHDQNPSNKPDKHSKNDAYDRSNTTEGPGERNNPHLSTGVKRSHKPITTGAESTFDSILKLQEKLHQGKMIHQSSFQPPVNISTGNMDTCTQGNACIEKACDYKPPCEGSVDYNLWRFGQHSIIVKSNIHAMCGNNKVQAATIVPKMEYQPHFGHEQISISELTKLWMSLLLQPGSKVIQGRINAFTSDLMMLEHFDMNSTLWNKPSFQPSRCMKMMFQVLDKLSSLPEGSYLLCHSAGDMHTSILQSANHKGNKRSSFDLHHTYTEVPTVQSCPPPLLPWLPLDTNLILPSQMALGRIPATFPPNIPGKNLKGSHAGPTKRTSKKKKKKKSLKK